jgi:hypothetical protein
MNMADFKAEKKDDFKPILFNAETAPIRKDRIRRKLNKALRIIQVRPWERLPFEKMHIVGKRIRRCLNILQKDITKYINELNIE